MKDKAELRRVFRRLRCAVSAADRTAASRTACARLADLPLGEAVAVYLAGADEIDLSDFIADALSRGIRLMAPRWDGETYRLAELKGLYPPHVRKGPFGIMEPCVAAAGSLVPSAWIVPGLAFSRDGRRLGYGGGWYDRLLADAAPSARVIGVAYDFQVVDELPHEPHDRALTDILSVTLPSASPANAILI